MNASPIDMPVSAPHTTTELSVPRVMGIVLLALTPATLFGFWLYGWPAFWLWFFTLAAAAAGEAACLRMMARPAVSYTHLTLPTN
jgi:Na+-translocating ferredoxin:NAD+ oxidoreductase RnfD subunit